MAGELRAQSPREGVGTSLPNLERLTYDDPTPAVSLQETGVACGEPIRVAQFPKLGYASRPGHSGCAACGRASYHGRKDVGP